MKFEKFQLEEVCDRIRSGKNIKAQFVHEEGVYPVYGGNGIRGYTDTANFEGECAIVGRQGAFCGNVRYFQGKAYMTEHAVVICANENHNTRYLAYLLSQMNLGRLSAQSAQPGLSVKTLSKQFVQLPDKINQDKIALILSAIENKVSLNQKINDNLEQQARTLFKVWFQNDSSTNNSSERPLSELCEMVTKGTTPTTLGRSFTERGINFIKAESISDSHVLDPSRFAHIDEETHALLKRSIIRDQDIIFTIAGTLGRFALIDESVLPANTNQAVAIIRTNKNIVSPYYLYSFFIANWHNEYYAKHVQQAVQANLSLTTIKSLPIPVLSDDAMKEYLAQITPIFELIKNNEQESRKLSNLRDALLPKLMSGEIDVSDIHI